MNRKEKNTIDVSRLYSVKDYSILINKNYGTVYHHLLNTLSGRSKNPYNLVKVSNIDFIYVTEEEEAEFLSVNNK